LHQGFAPSFFGVGTSFSNASTPASLLVSNGSGMCQGFFDGGDCIKVFAYHFWSWNIAIFQRCQAQRNFLVS
jgi:hypothetical protein